MILSGRLKPGEKLVENELCKEFGMSRAPIRESLRVLESQGLVVIKPRKGAYVRKLTRKDVLDAVAVRQNLEGLAMELAISNMQSAHIQELEDFVDKMDIAAKKNDIESFVDNNILFHNYLADHSHNNILIDILGNLWQLVWRRTYVLTCRSNEEILSANEGHRQIINAIKVKDKKLARELMEKHIRISIQRVLNLMGY